MSAGPDDLEKLLGDVRKTINDNERFLLTIMEDASEEVEPDGFADDPEAFEEL